jgi:hypothetical protein
MHEDNLLPELVRTLQSGWGIEAHASDPSDWERVRAELEARIAVLLRDNPRKLTTAMYLLDISEKDFAAAMEAPTMDDRAHALSCVVMERETAKIRTRMRYRSNGLLE